MAILLPAGSVRAQEGAPSDPPPAPSAAVLPDLQADYVLAPDDQLSVRVAHVADMSSQPYRVDADGMLTLPLVGKITAAGLTVTRLEATLVERYSVYIRKPLVTVALAEYRFEPVFAVGAFRSPGVYPIRGRKTLVEMLAQLGGLEANASRRVRLIRRLDAGPIPLPESVEDKENRVMFVDIDMPDMIRGVSPADSLELRPFDVLKATVSGQVFVNGEVAKAGALDLSTRRSIGVIEAVSLAGGLTKDAKADEAVILRPVPESTARTSIPINLKEVLAGKGENVQLLANDVLMVPKGGAMSNSAWQTIIPAAIGAAVAATVISVR